MLVGTLRPEDCSPDANFVIKDEIPIVVLDSLDKYWAGEAKHRLPLNGVRVPVEADTGGLRPSGRWRMIWGRSSACC